MQEEPNFYFKKCFKIAAHNNLNIEAITINQTEKLLLSCSRDQNIKLWDIPENLENGLTLRKDFPYHKSSVVSLKPLTNFYKPNFFISLSNDETLKYWDFFQKKCLKTIKLKGSVSSCFVHENIIYVAFGRDDLYLIKALNLYSGTVKQELKGHVDVISSLLVCKNLQILISVSRDKTIAFWSLKSKNPFIKPLKIHHKAHKQGITSMLLLENKRILITGANDHLIKLWSLKEKELNLTLMKTLTLHKGWILALCPIKEDFIVSSASDDVVRVWKVDTGECIEELNDENLFSPGSLLFVQEKKLLLVGDKNGYITGWEFCGENAKQKTF